ncbi:MMPL family transporter [Streptomyces sp. SID14515]|nr:MMPL family transporter [Streptomyces sp. SID14515]NEB42170.1 MMPL family transporter [Streptomyces sp. SID14515]
MGTLGRWCFRHRWIVIMLWIVAFAGIGMINGAIGGPKYSNSLTLPGNDSTKALELMQAEFPEQAGESASIVWKAESGSVRDPEVQQKIGKMLQEVDSLPQIGRVAGPYEPQGAAQISENGKIAYAQLSFSVPFEDIKPDQVKKLVKTAKAVSGDQLDVQLGGGVISFADEPPANLSEIVGVIAAAIILYFAFGSFLAMLVPLVTALFSVGVGLSSVGLASHVTSVPEFSSMLGMLIGLGVGIDYALFIVTRYRANINRGLSPEDAATGAVNTSGRAVLFAGATVCISLLGMFVIDLDFLNGMAVAASLVVLTTMLAAVTLLPGLLGVMKGRVLSRRQRRKLAERGPETEHPAGLAVRWSRIVEQRPRILSAVALIVMVALAIPTFSLRLGFSDQGNNPSTTTTRKAYDLLAEGFGDGSNGPLQLVAVVNSPQESAALDSVVAEVKGAKGVASAVAAPAAPGSDLRIVQVVPETSPQSAETSELITRLRDDIVPDASADSSLKVYIGGTTAVSDDFADALAQKLPLFIGVVVVLGFLLLMLAFRSLLIPLTAALMNVLAVASSFGAVVLIFQWGFGADLLGVGEGPVEAFLPVIMLSMLFGLSMDYQVFLVSRMHEEWVHGKDNATSVRTGLAETSRVINAAAIIMIAVFGSFVLSGQRAAAMFGLGLAAAVALDAFILRTMLVPALMHLFGKNNWWLPGWLDKRMPHLAVELPDEPVPAPRPVAVADTEDDTKGDDRLIPSGR